LKNNNLNGAKKELLGDRESVESTNLIINEELNITIERFREIEDSVRRIFSEPPKRFGREN
jgi:hypothetical protein